jgi:hypothetical protein
MTDGPARWAVIGAAEHANTVTLVTLSNDGALQDRRTLELTHGLPTHPYHHEGSWAVGRYTESPWARPTTIAQALEAIAAVKRAAEAGAANGLDALAKDLALPVSLIAIRRCAALPADDRECIEDARAAAAADSILYRRALASAAERRGWKVDHYDRDEAPARARAAFGADLDERIRAMGKRAGAPWQAKHKLAATVALAAIAALTRS